MSDLEAADIDIQHRQPADDTAGLSVFAETSNALLARLGRVAHSANRFAPVGWLGKLAAQPTVEPFARVCGCWNSACLSTRPGFGARPYPTLLLRAKTLRNYKRFPCV